MASCDSMADRLPAKRANASGFLLPLAQWADARIKPRSPCHTKTAIANFVCFVYFVVRKLKSIKTILSVSGLCIERGGTAILREVNWRVQRGEHWVMLGANGSGK